MEHDTNTFDKLRKVLPGMSLLYSFATLILVAILLYVTFGKNGSFILSSLDCLATIILKAALTYFLIEIAGFLHKYQKQLQQRPTKKQKNKRDTIESVVEKTSENRKKTPSVSVVSEPQDTQIDKPCSFDCCPPDAPPVVEEPLYNREEKCSARQQWFSFQDSDVNTRMALDIIEGIRQGPVFLASTDKGELTGIEVTKGLYSVLPYEEWLTEVELRYSPITVCFEITGLTCWGQQVKVRCDKPAVLAKTEDGLYEIAEKGLLTVISTTD